MYAALRRLLTPRTKTPPLSSADGELAPALDVITDINAKPSGQKTGTGLSYPGGAQEYPYYTPDQILKSQQETINKFLPYLPEDNEWKQEFVWPVLRNFAAQVHLVPASENNHHCGVGGLVRHTMETVLKATKRARTGVEWKAGEDLKKYDSHMREDYTSRAVYATFLAALFHDVAKPYTDMTLYHIRSQTGEPVYWVPYSGSIHQWMEKQKVSRYQITYLPGRHRVHDAFKQGLFHDLVPQYCREYILELEDGLGREIYDMMLCALSQDLGDSMISQFVREADSKSAEEDLKGENRLLGEKRVSNPPAPTVVRIIEELIKQGIIEFATKDKPTGALIHTHEGELFMVWRPVWRIVKDYAGTRSIPLLMDEYKVIEDFMDRGLAEMWVGKGSPQVFWHIRHELIGENGVLCLKLTENCNLMDATGYRPTKLGITMVKEEPNTEASLASQVQSQSQPVTDAAPAATLESAATPPELTGESSDDDKHVASHYIEDKKEAGEYLAFYARQIGRGQRVQGKDYFFDDTGKICVFHPEGLESMGVSYTEVRGAWFAVGILEANPANPIVAVTQMHVDGKDRQVVRMTPEATKHALAIAKTHGDAQQPDKTVAVKPVKPGKQAQTTSPPPPKPQTKLDQQGNNESRETAEQADKLSPARPQGASKNIPQRKNNNKNKNKNKNKNNNQSRRNKNKKTASAAQPEARNTTPVPQKQSSRPDKPAQPNPSKPPVHSAPEPEQELPPVPEQEYVNGSQGPAPTGPEAESPRPAKKPAPSQPEQLDIEEEAEKAAKQEKVDREATERKAKNAKTQDPAYIGKARDFMRNIIVAEQQGTLTFTIKREHGYALIPKSELIRFVKSNQKAGSPFFKLNRGQVASLMTQIADDTKGYAKKQGSSAAYYRIPEKYTR